MASNSTVLDRPIAPTVEVEVNLVQVATEIIQKHTDKEARNRQLPGMQVKDLCAAQKKALVDELSTVFRG